MFTSKLTGYFFFGLLSCLLLFFSNYQITSAQALPVQTELDGYAWSGTIGWISLNCKTGGATGNDVCAISNYKVVINTDRTATGYAWSSNVGWVKFGGLSSYPSGSGTSAVRAGVTGIYPSLTFEGWVRACAGTTAGDCSAMTSRTDGWDGWISLRGTGYQVQTNSGGFATNSYAWGDAVVGWVDMFTNTAWLRPSVILTVGDCFVPIGASTCAAPVTWNIINTSNPRVRNTTSGSVISSSLIGNVVQTFTLGDNRIEALADTLVLDMRTGRALCTPPGLLGVGTTCELPPPAVTMTASKKIARKGATVSVSWTITPSPPESGTCTLIGPGLSGTVTMGGTQTSAPLSSFSKFTISCTGPYGSIEAAAVVEIVPEAKEV